MIPKKPAPHLMRGGYRFSEKIMPKQDYKKGEPMKSILAAVGAALLTIMLALHAAPSGAQGRPEDKQKQMEQEAADRAKAKKASDNAYKSAIERLPDQKFDPWRNLR